MSKRFPRQNWFRFKKLGIAWRRTKGGQSKIRLCRKGRMKKPDPGYGSPRSRRFLVNGLKAVLVKNINGMENVKEDEVAVLSSSLGMKKILEVAEIAKLKGVKILNKKKVEKASKALKKKAKKKEISEKPTELKEIQEVGDKAEQKTETKDKPEDDNRESKE